MSILHGLTGGLTRQLLAGAIVVGTLGSAMVAASAQPYPPPPPGWGGPHYFWHGQHWHHREWAWRNHHRYYRYY